jgi:hypothetical protein
MTYPTAHDLDTVTAFMGGYIEEGELTVITIAKALDVMRGAIDADVEIDGVIASRILRRLGFRRSYSPFDAQTITYRSNT